MWNVLNTIAAIGELEAWQQVPELVKTRYKEASQVQRVIRKVMKHLPQTTDYGDVYWNPDSKTVWCVFGDGESEQVIQRWHNSFKAITGVRNVKSEAEYGPHSDPDWIRIKRASALSWLNMPYQAAGALTGGPSPMSNGIVSGLLGAGAGYATGTLLENTLPAQMVERGRLRKNLAMLGGGMGAAMHIPQAYANASINQDATGQPHWMRSIFGNNASQQLAPHALNGHNNLVGGQKQADWEAMRSVCNRLPLPGILFRAATLDFTKEAMSAGLFGSEDVPLREVPVDAFNNAIWNDVYNGVNSSQSNPYGTRSYQSDNSDRMSTPPANAAAAAGLVSGIQQMYGNPPTLSPRHFISGLAHAGIDLATARIAGGVLGALGGLTPAAQKQLQNAGIWSGMIRGVTGSVLGLQ